MSDFFAGVGLRIDGLVHLSPREAAAAIERGAVLVDIREPFMVEMKAFGVPSVVYLPRRSFRQLADQLPSDAPLIIADAVGLYSKEEAAWLMERGRADVASLNGGIADWEGAGLPMQDTGDAEWRGSCMCQLRPRRRG